MIALSSDMCSCIFCIPVIVKHIICPLQQSLFLCAFYSLSILLFRARGKWLSSFWALPNCQLQYPQSHGSLLLCCEQENDDDASVRRWFLFFMHGRDRQTLLGCTLVAFFTCVRSGMYRTGHLKPIRIFQGEKEPPGKLSCR